MTSIIADLEQQVEHWRQRAEVAEAALGIAGSWCLSVSPLSLQRTRIMRLLLARDMLLDHVTEVLGATYPGISREQVRVQISIIRSVLPPIISPTNATKGRPYSIPDRPALKAWLETGQLPIRRAA